VQQTRKRVKQQNKLMKEVEQKNLAKGGKAKWDLMNEDSCQEFPTVSLEDLEVITIGPFQIKIGVLYNEQHLRVGNGSYKYFSFKPEKGLLRVRMKSRFSRAQSHFVWIKFKEHGSGHSAIKSYYCDCKTGARTLGCCGHVSAVIRYLGNDRFEAPQKRRNYTSYLLDAAEQLAQEENDAEDVGESEVQYEFVGDENEEFGDSDTSSEASDSDSEASDVDSEENGDT